MLLFGIHFLMYWGQVLVVICPMLSWLNGVLISSRVSAESDAVLYALCYDIFFSLTSYQGV